MKTERIGRACACAFLALLFFACAVWSQIVLARRCPVARPALSAGAFAVFGAFRSLVSEVTWFRAERLQQEGRYVELAQLARALTLSEPHTPEVWSYAAWNLAYNVSVMMPDAESRWRWVETAMKLLRDDGLRLNPGSPEICRELAWLFEFKMGVGGDAAAAFYCDRWRATVADVQQRGAWVELGMRVDVMTALERELGVTDRTDPFYSAIYWAQIGLQRATGTDRAFLEEVVRQALVLYRKKTAGSSAASQ